MEDVPVIQDEFDADWIELKEQIKAIPTLPLLEILEATDELLNELPDEYYPLRLHFQVKRHIRQLKEKEKE